MLLSHRRLVAGPLLAIGLLVAATVPTAVAAGPASTAGSVSAAGDRAKAKRSDAGLTVVQANLQSPQSADGFQKDARTVFAQDPDLITFNEVAFRYDMFLAPQGYEVWRTPGQYEGASPVAWRTSRFSVIDKGTRQISNYKPRPPGKKTRLGMRYASWVTLTDRQADRRISLVSAHVPPATKGMPDLRRATAKRIANLVTDLGKSGTVIVGGDFNMHYRASAYTGDVFAGAGMRPTYEILGNHFPTGDHRGATIDYLFVRGEQGYLTLQRHFPVELRSDHDAVVAQFAVAGGGSGGEPPVDPPGEEPGENPGGNPGGTHLQSDPNGDAAARRVVVDKFVERIDAARPGGVVEVATTGLTLTAVGAAIRRAQARGVWVRLLTRSSRLTAVENRLKGILESEKSGAVRQCGDACKQSLRGEARSILVVTSPDTVPRVRVTTTRRLDTVVREYRTVVSINRDPATVRSTAEAYTRSWRAR